MVAEASHENSPEPVEVPVAASEDVAEAVIVEHVELVEDPPAPPPPAPAPPAAVAPSNVPHRDSHAQSNPKPVSPSYAVS